MALAPPTRSSGGLRRRGSRFWPVTNSIPKNPTYTTILTKIKGLSPDALYYGGVGQAGAKLAKQAYEVIPRMLIGGGDGMYGGSPLKGAGFPVLEGWYATIAAPHLLNGHEAQSWVDRFDQRWGGKQPSDYSITRMMRPW